MKIKRALLSVSDKTGLVELAKILVHHGVELISTGGTATELANAGLPVNAVSDVTKFPEMLDGRVKTLHPMIHGGLLAVRDNAEHMSTIARHGINPIDLVIINLYPFAATIAKPGVTREEAIENIDIGGPSMVRSASKNHESVTVVTSPADYPTLIEQLKAHNGETTLEFRRELAAKAFAHTGAYDSMIAGYLRKDIAGFPDVLPIGSEKVGDLRYGENPHQSAAFYRISGFTAPGVTNATQLHGKELSFNNIYDINGAYELAQDFASDSLPFAAIIKHANPCGAALGETLADAFNKAREADPISAFGGILALTRPVDVATAEAITAPNTFFEAIIAPGYDKDAFDILTTKKKWGANLILLETPNRTKALDGQYEYKYVAGGLLAQTPDNIQSDASNVTTVTKRDVTDSELSDLLFAWKVVKHVKSNAITIAKDNQLIGVGAGQMNRVQSVRLALQQAGEKAKGAALASDAFFPFNDSVETAAKAGVTAVIQPGGSKKDAESIDMADQYNVAMVTTGIRHFRH
jgi:phosphoribosylaminoimidazolecarboxamide formyltransferase/IMP cyclohydrolase